MKPKECTFSSKIEDVKKLPTLDYITNMIAQPPFLGTSSRNSHYWRATDGNRKRCYHQDLVNWDSMRHCNLAAGATCRIEAREDGHLPGLHGVLQSHILIL